MILFRLQLPIGCGKCLEQAHYLAISQENDKAVVDPAECLGYLWTELGLKSIHVCLEGDKETSVLE